MADPYEAAAAGHGHNASTNCTPDGGEIRRRSWCGNVDAENNRGAAVAPRNFPAPSGREIKAGRLERERLDPRGYCSSEHATSIHAAAANPDVSV